MNKNNLSESTDFKDFMVSAMLKRSKLTLEFVRNIHSKVEYQNNIRYIIFEESFDIFIKDNNSETFKYCYPKKHTHIVELNPMEYIKLLETTNLVSYLHSLGNSSTTCLNALEEMIRITSIFNFPDKQKEKIIHDFNFMCLIYFDGEENSKEKLNSKLELSSEYKEFTKKGLEKLILKYYLED